MILDAVKKAGLTAAPSETNFVFVKVADADAVQKAMAARNIIIRGAYGEWNHWSRVSTGKIEDVKRYCEALPQVVGWTLAAGAPTCSLRNRLRRSRRSTATAAVAPATTSAWRPQPTTSSRRIRTGGGYSGPVGRGTGARPRDRLRSWYQVSLMMWIQSYSTAPASTESTIPTCSTPTGTPSGSSTSTVSRCSSERRGWAASGGRGRCRRWCAVHRPRHAGERTVPEVNAMPRSIQEILDHADALAARFERYTPDVAHERPVEEYLLERAVIDRARSERQIIEAITAARGAGMSWLRIGGMLGTSAQAAQQRYAALVEPT